MGISHGVSNWNHSEGVDITSLTVTLNGVTAGSSIIVGASGGVVGGVATYTCADDKGNTYKQLATQNNTGGGYNYQGYTFAAHNVIGGNIIVTISMTESQQYVRINAVEYKGVCRSTPIGGVGSAKLETNSSTATDAVTTGQFAVSGSGSMIWCYGFSVNTVPTVTVGTGFSQVMDMTPYQENMVEDRLLVGRPSTVAGTLTFGTGAYYIIMAAELIARRRVNIT